jgi:hypothetical protein
MQDIFWSGAVETVEGTKGGSLSIGVVGGGLLCNTVAGYLDPPLATRIMETGDAAIAQAGKITMFCNWHGMTGYQTSCRTELTDWASAKGSAIDHIHILIGSKIVGMGVSVASMFVRQLVSHRDAPSFAKAFQAAEARLRSARR